MHLNTFYVINVILIMNILLCLDVYRIFGYEFCFCWENLW